MSTKKGRKLWRQQKRKAEAKRAPKGAITERAINQAQQRVDRHCKMIEAIRKPVPVPRAPMDPRDGCLKGMTPRFVKSDAFLESYEWRQLRMRALCHFGPKCMCCGAIPEQAMICVDHVRSRRKHPELALSFNNLQILCSPCNHGKGNAEVDWRVTRIIHK